MAEIVMNGGVESADSGINPTLQDRKEKTMNLMSETMVDEMMDLIDSPVGYPWPRQKQRTFIGHVGIDTWSELSFIDEILDHALHGSGTRQIVTVNAQI